MELGGRPEKMDEYFHWGPIFYIYNFARKWIFSIYKDVYYIHNSLWEGTTWIFEIPKLKHVNKQNPPK